MVMGSRIRAVPLPEVKALMVDDIVPDEIGDGLGIQGRRYPYDTHHGAAEADPATIVMAGPGHVRVGYILGVQEAVVEKSVHGFHQIEMDSDLATDQVTAPLDVQWTVV